MISQKQQTRYVLALALLAFLLKPSLTNSETITLNPVADAYVLADAPSNNYGGESTVAIGIHTEIIGYMRFDLSAISTAATINSATLELQTRSIFDAGDVLVGLTNGPWTEYGVTWNNRPGWDLPVDAFTPPGQFMDWSINVRDQVVEWTSGDHGNYGFYFEGTSGFVIIRSRSASVKPRLVVTYTEPNVKPTISMLQPATNITVTVGEDVPISWNGTDPDDAATVTLFYDTDCNPDNGGFHLIGGTSFPEDGSTNWNTNGVEPETYRVYGAIDDGNHGTDIDFDCADGTVTVQANVKPSIVMIEPSSDIFVPTGGDVLINWNGTDPDDEALVVLFYDTDCDPDNGGFTMIGGTGFPEDGNYTWDTEGVDPGTYRIYGIIDDGNHGTDVDVDCADGSVSVGEVSVQFTPPFAGATAGNASREIVDVLWTTVGHVPSTEDPTTGRINQKTTVVLPVFGGTVYEAYDSLLWDFEVPYSGQYLVTLSGNANGRIYSYGEGIVSDAKHGVWIGAGISGRGWTADDLYNTFPEDLTTGWVEIGTAALLAIKNTIGCGGICWGFDVVLTAAKVLELYEQIQALGDALIGFDEQVTLQFYANLTAGQSHEFNYYIWTHTKAGVSGAFLMSMTDVEFEATSITLEYVPGQLGPIIQVAPVSDAVLSEMPIGQSVNYQNVFTVTNVGDSPLNGSVSITTGPFSVANSSTYNLAPSAFHHVDITAFSTVPGSFVRDVTFTGGGGAARTVSCQIVDQDPVLAVYPATEVDFDSVDVGFSSEMEAFVIVNEGGGTLSGTALVDAPFSIVSEDTYNLSQGQGQSITVGFDPTSESTFTRNVTFTGAGGATRTVTGVGRVVVSVDDIDSQELPDDFSLSQNYPNPFNPETRIEFALPRASHVTIDVYNIVGKRVRNLANERLSAGLKAVTWDGRDNNGQLVSSGIYFYRIVTGDFTESKKMVLLK